MCMHNCIAYIYIRRNLQPVISKSTKNSFTSLPIIILNIKKLFAWIKFSYLSYLFSLSPRRSLLSSFIFCLSAERPRCPQETNHGYFMTSSIDILSDDRFNNRIFRRYDQVSLFEEFKRCRCSFNWNHWTSI